ncbi:class IV adenylate cyclase [Streptomyces sp. NPDC006798]|uniref:class IV adenylate cyclase n=1 Tax=Streptomyces sp. NPDC006798 TaxID=3155462 RepID=UPI0033CDE9DD
MIEAELKARVRDPEGVRRRLDALAVGRVEVYRDTYYDTPDHALDADGRGLRVRTVHSDAGDRALLTYKGQVADEDSGSKPEYGSRVADPDAVHGMLRGLGYVPLIAFEKHCRNYTFTARERPVLATLVRVPELGNDTFLELETPAEETDPGPRHRTSRTGRTRYPARRPHPRAVHRRRTRQPCDNRPRTVMP